MQPHHATLRSSRSLRSVSASGGRPAVHSRSTLQLGADRRPPTAHHVLRTDPSLAHSVNRRPYGSFVSQLEEDPLRAPTRCRSALRSRGSARELSEVDKPAVIRPSSRSAVIRAGPRFTHRSLSPCRRSRLGPDPYQLYERQARTWERPQRLLEFGKHKPASRLHWSSGFTGSCGGGRFEVGRLFNKDYRKLSV